MCGVADLYISYHAECLESKSHLIDKTLSFSVIIRLQLFPSRMLMGEYDEENGTDERGKVLICFKIILMAAALK